MERRRRSSSSRNTIYYCLNAHFSMSDMMADIKNTYKNICSNKKGKDWLGLNIENCLLLLLHHLFYISLQT